MPVWEIERDRFGVLFSGPLAVGECVRVVPEAEVERLREVIQEYAQHDSWRCGHPDRYPQDEDCPCGLLSTLRDAGLDWERWRANPDAS